MKNLIICILCTFLIPAVIFPEFLFLKDGSIVEMKNAKENGALSLSITTFMKSAITRYSDITLLTAPVLSLYQKIDLPSKVSQTAILDVLYLLVVLKNRERATRFISKAEEELSRSKVR